MRKLDLIRRTLFLLLLFGIRLSGHAASWEPTLNQVSWKGEVKRLVLLVETRERPFYTPNANYEYNQMLNAEHYTGLGCEGSARQFLIDNSGGKFKPQFIVVGPLVLSKSMGYYGGKPLAGEGSDGDVGKMVIEACKMAKELHGIDFSQFDYNNDNLVDNVYLFHSGPNDTSIPTPWPHASGVAGGGLHLDGKLVDSYAVSQEMATETIRGAYSTFLHEFGHTLGMPDDYSGRLGKFSIYCDGTFDGGVIPVNLNSAERLILGWLDYDEMDHDGQYTLQPHAKNRGLMLKTNNPDEYFLFENRNNSREVTPWDSHFEYKGMLIWHIDRSQNTVTWTDEGGSRSNTALGMWGMNAPNGAPLHPCHELIEADKINNPSAYRAGMYFPGDRHQTTLDSQSHPEFRTWSGLPLGIQLTDITQQSNGEITFTVKKTNSASLSVTVKNSDDKLLINTYLSLTPVNEQAVRSKLARRVLKASGQKLTGDTGLSGTCLFTDIAAGKYQLLADKEGYPVYIGYVDLVEGDNTIQVTIQSQDEVSGAELKWHGSQDFWAVFFVPGQIRAVGFDTNDLAPYVGQRLEKVNIQLGGTGNTGDLYVFVDDQVVYCKPMQNIVAGGRTTIDLSAENIIIEAGKSLKTGYLLKTGAQWPSTCTSPQTEGKGGLISTDNGQSWLQTNDLNANWVISVVVRDAGTTAAESVEFDDPLIEMAVGDEQSLHANVRPTTVIDRRVTWQSSDEAIVSVAQTGTLTARAVGAATITATSVQNPQVSGSCKVTVKMSSAMIEIVTYQREAKISWPGYNPDHNWKVRWRKATDPEYVSMPEQTQTSIYLKGLIPGGEYEGTIEALDQQNSSPVSFSFTTNALASEYAVLCVAKKRFAVGETLPLIASNIVGENHTVVWTLNGTPLEEPEYTFTQAGPCTLKALITYADSATEVLVKELEITK